MIVVELEGLEVAGRHGVEEQERCESRPFLYDIRLEVPDAALSDRIDDAVDYREVAACVQEVSEATTFHLLEALAGAVADSIVERFPVDRVRVRVRKPEPPGLPAAHAAATVERSSASASA